MTRKTATLWKRNPSKYGDSVAYSAPAVTYNSTTTPYSTATTGLDDFGKTAGSWTRQGKTATQFVPNPAANTNLYPYDSATFLYDSASQTYDGIVTGQSFASQKTPSVWSEG